MTGQRRSLRLVDNEDVDGADLDAQLDAPEFLLPGLALRPGRRERQQRTQDEDNDRTGAHRRKGSEIIEASGFRPT